MGFDKTAVPCRSRRPNRQLRGLICGHRVAQKHVVLSMHVKGTEVELAHVPLPIGTRAIKAFISHAGSRDRSAVGSLERGGRFTEITVDADPLQTQSWHFETLV